MNEFYINGTGLGIGNRYKARVIERRAGHPDEGKVVYETPWFNNLILSKGMDALASGLVCDLFTYCAVGVAGPSGVTPVADLSSGVTATTSGTACTASSSAFGPSGTGWHSGDIGKLIVFSNHAHAIITAVGASGTTCTLSKVLNIASGLTFTDYYVQLTALDSEVQRTNTYITGIGNCGTTFNLTSGIYTHTRTFQFPVDSGHLYTDVGFSGTSGVLGPSGIGGTLNVRGLLGGAGVSVGAGQQLQILYNLFLTVTPVQPRSKSANIAGWVGTSGVEQLAGDQFSVVNQMGQTSLPTSGVIIGEPSSQKSMGISTDNTPIPTYNSAPPLAPSVVAGGVIALAASSYTPGSNLLTWTGTYGTGAGITSSLYKLFTTDAVSQLESGLIFFFNSPQTKASLFTLTITWQYAWDWLL